MRGPLPWVLFYIPLMWNVWLCDASYVTWKYIQYRIYHVIFARKYKTLQNVNILGAGFHSSGTLFFWGKRYISWLFSGDIWIILFTLPRRNILIFLSCVCSGKNLVPHLQSPFRAVSVFIVIIFSFARKFVKPVRNTMYFDHYYNHIMLFAQNHVLQNALSTMHNIEHSPSS